MSRFPAPALLLALISCGGPSEPDPGPPPELPAFADLAMPDVEDISSLPLRAPPEPPTVLWDFAAGRLHSFRLRQEASGALTAKFLGREERQTVGTKDEGYFNLRGTGNGFAQGELKLAPRERVVDGKAQDVNKLDPSLLTLELSEHNELSQVTPVKGGLDPTFLEFLFPVPPASLQPGQSIDYTLAHPARENRPARKGTVRTTLTGYAKVERYECARLVSEIDLSITPVAPAEGLGRLRGRVVSYFAPAERRFVHVSAALVTSLRTRTVVTRADQSRVWSVGTYDTTSTLTAHIGN